ncbi:uncharacterized protein PV06_03321 [Exophiala oligosperma]|uniref:Cell wall anchored protein n=1 Tax=Exophiala oligosperma TaxID=215243 RepID=A0A0D2DPX2_9EURO|nr:uncharacterized protein PV06_03321 [Exophiala oligosperma]KIW44883.1 hypothetical protein PV06_03321 [Exophiala oligosperma]
MSQYPRRYISGSVEGFSGPINVHDASLFAGKNDSTTLHMFGGTTSGFNESFRYFEVAPTTQYAVWSYDMRDDTWLAVDTSGALDTIPSWGASTEVPDLGLAFFVGGQIDSGTADTTQNLGDETIGVGGMVVINTTTNNVKNLTVDESVRSNRQGAGMVYVANFGESGVLVLLGGETQADGLLAMDDITTFDVNSTDLSDSPSPNTNFWYSQKASGDIPSSRTDFCLVAAPAQDNSSTNIYLYGGTSESTIFDDIYVLSLPSFTWVKVFTGQDACWSVTCHFLARRQMITVGGGGKSSNISHDCNWEQKSLAVLDLSTISWGSVFDANAGQYDVPDDVVAAIGGDPTGGATKTQPEAGWTDSSLSRLFSIKTATTSSVPGTTSTAVSNPYDVSSDTDHGISGGAVAGIVIGAVAFVAIACGGIFFYSRSRRSAKDTEVRDELEKDGLPSYSSDSSQGTAELV